VVERGQFCCHAAKTRAIDDLYLIANKKGEESRHLIVSKNDNAIIIAKRYVWDGGIVGFLVGIPTYIL